jgi:hypothetical protein
VLEERGERGSREVEVRGPSERRVESCVGTIQQREYSLECRLSARSGLDPGRDMQERNTHVK